MKKTPLQILIYLSVMLTVASQSCSNIKELFLGSKKNYFIVLCDVSNSIGDSGNNASAKVADNAVSILKKISSSSGTTVRFQLITKEGGYTDIMEYSSKSISADEFERTEEDLNKKCQQLRQTIIKEAQGKVSNTCILKSIKRTYNDFKQQDKIKDMYNFKIIILSDLIEACDGIYLRKNIFNPKIIPEDFFKNTNFAGLGVKWQFITSGKCDIEKERDFFWKQALSMMGYNEEEINDNFLPVAEVPDEI